MRKIDYLIREVRKRTNTLDSKAISPIEVASYFNQVLKTIVNFATREGNNSGIMQKFHDIDIIPGTPSYPLPEGLQMDSSIDTVLVIRDNRFSGTLKRVNFADKGGWGSYAIVGKEIFVSPCTQHGIIRVVYNGRVRNVSPVCATVDSVVGQVISFDGKIPDFLLEDEVVTINNMSYPVSSFTTTSMTLVGDLSPINNGDLILLGNDTTREVELPDEVEPYLLRAVEKLIRHRRSSVKLGAATALSEEELRDLLDILGKVSTDANFPVIMDTDYMEI